MLNKIEALCPLAGRIILGLYFLLPGALLKVVNFQGTADYMAAHNMIMIPFFLVLTIVVQLLGGLGVMIGYKTKLSAFLLAGLTLVISLVMHNFWVVEDALIRSHETQNFVKNMGIMAGLLAIAGLGAGPFSVDNKKR
ncbi:MAG: DoxX family protein [Pseudohongiellaceae bacterium]|nr:DoxX family protein [Pseudohongiellaceae bacterium]